MRYFIYISDTKVDMLLPQIPQSQKQKISAELKFDIKLLSASVTSEKNTFDNNINRLIAVEKYLNNSENIGSHNDSENWFKGTAEAKIWIDNHLHKIVFFLIKLSETEFVLLGGTSTNLIGYDKAEKAQIAKSNVSAILDGLEHFLKTEKYINEKLIDWHWPLDEKGKQIFKDEKDIAFSNLLILAEMWDELKQPTQKISYLARKYKVMNEEGYLTMTMGSPLMVWLADRNKKTIANNGYNSLWQRVKTKFKL